MRAKALQLVAGVPDGADVDLSLVRLPEGALALPAIGTMTELRSPASVSAMFIRRACELGFANLGLHDLRALHSTALLDRLVPVHVVTKLIGDDPATCYGPMLGAPRRPAKAAEAIAALLKAAWVVIGP